MRFLLNHFRNIKIISSIPPKLSKGVIRKRRKKKLGDMPVKQNQRIWLYHVTYSRLSYCIIVFKIIGKTTPRQNNPNILNLHEIDAHKQLEHVSCILSSSLRGLSVGMQTCIDPNPSTTSCDDWILLLLVTC